jgi:hypothetical protein
MLQLDFALLLTTDHISRKKAIGFRDGNPPELAETPKAS